MAVLGLCLAVGTAYYAYKEASASAELRVASLRFDVRALADRIETDLIEEIREALVAADHAEIPRESPEDSYRRDHPLARTIVLLDDGVFYTWPRTIHQTVQVDRALAPPQYGIAEEEEWAEGGDLLASRSRGAGSGRRQVVQMLSRGQRTREHSSELQATAQLALSQSLAM